MPLWCTWCWGISQNGNASPCAHHFNKLVVACCYLFDSNCECAKRVKKLDTFSLSLSLSLCNELLVDSSCKKCENKISGSFHNGSTLCFEVHTKNHGK
jgi:hypothetical protein